MSTLVLDTDIASLSIKDQPPSRLHDRLNASLTCVTFVTIGGLTRWARLHSWGPRPRARLQMWLHARVRFGRGDGLVWECGVARRRVGVCFVPGG